MNTSLEIIRSAGTDHLCYRVEKDTFVAVHNQMLSPPVLPGGERYIRGSP